MKSLTALMALTAIEWTWMIGKMAVEEEVSTVTALLATEDEDVAAAETEVEETVTEVVATDEASPLFNLTPAPTSRPLQTTTNKFRVQPLTKEPKY
jgi:hypothetical protein